VLDIAENNSDSLGTSGNGRGFERPQQGNESPLDPPKEATLSIALSIPGLSESDAPATAKAVKAWLVEGAKAHPLPRSQGPSASDVAAFLASLDPRDDRTLDLLEGFLLAARALAKRVAR
jgi:hypothetical protein